MERDLAVERERTQHGAGRDASARGGTAGGSGRRALDEATERWQGGASVVGHPGRPSGAHPSLGRRPGPRSQPLPRTGTDGRDGHPSAGRVRRRDLPDGMTSLEFVLSPEDAEQLLRVLRAHPSRGGPTFRSNGVRGRWPGGGDRPA